MNIYVDALWDLKLRVDAYNEKDEKANKAFEILMAGVKKLIDPDTINTANYNKLISILKDHVEVQEHPDMFFHREQPERIVIDLRYILDTTSLLHQYTAEEIKENNENYNLVKRALGLPEYKEN